MADLPTHVTLTQVSAAFAALGLNIDDAVELHMAPAEVTLTRRVRGADGRYILDGAREELLHDTITIPVCSACDYPEDGAGADVFRHRHRTN